MMTTEDRNNWLAERKQGIGGSDAAAVLGISPWATPVTVWLDKTGRAPAKEETEAMRIGTALESFVAERYAEQTGRRVQRFNRMLHVGCLLGNVDRLVIPEDGKVAAHMGEVRTDTLLECKTSSREWDDGVPLYYQTQVQHYMGLEPKLQHADVACLFLGRKHFDVFRVERDDEVIRTMQERLTAWWNEYVVGDTMPPPANENDCKLIWTRSNPGKTIVTTREIAARLDDYVTQKATEKVAKENAAKAMSDICAYLGDAEVLTAPDGKPLLTWKSAKDSSKTDWEAIAKEIAGGQIGEEIIARHTATTPGSRRFLPKRA